jgi:hypothetical protein
MPRHKHIIYQLFTLRWICREAGDYTQYRGYGDTPEEAHQDWLHQMRYEQ